MNVSTLGTRGRPGSVAYNLSFQGACGNLVICALRNSGRSKYRLLGNKLRNETRRSGEIYIKDNFCKKWKPVHLRKAGLIIISYSVKRYC